MAGEEMRYVFTSESVSEGHPDKVCDFISDSVLDACLAQDARSRVACETLCKSDIVVLAGEITTNAKLDYDKVARDTIRQIGYTDAGEAFNADGVKVHIFLTAQANEIDQGVSAERACRANRAPAIRASCLATPLTRPPS